MKLIDKAIAEARRIKDMYNAGGRERNRLTLGEWDLCEALADDDDVLRNLDAMVEAVLENMKANNGEARL